MATIDAPGPAKSQDRFGIGRRFRSMMSTCNWIKELFVETEGLMPREIDHRALVPHISLWGSCFCVVSHHRRLSSVAPPATSDSLTHTHARIVLAWQAQHLLVAASILPVVSGGGCARLVVARSASMLLAVVLVWVRGWRGRCRFTYTTHPHTGHTRTTHAHTRSSFLRPRLPFFRLPTRCGVVVRSYYFCFLSP